jgi:hypothetical protein
MREARAYLQNWQGIILRYKERKQSMKEEEDAIYAEDLETDRSVF